MKIRIIIAYEPRYRRGHRWQFVPPITGIHLAGLTPPGHEVEVIHQQVRPVPVDDEPDLVALSFFSGFARAGYKLADAYRGLGVPEPQRHRMLFRRGSGAQKGAQKKGTAKLPQWPSQAHLTLRLPRIRKLRGCPTPRDGGPVRN